MLDGLGSAIGSGLGFVGDVLDTPRRLIYSGGNALYKALSGDEGPDIEHFSDLLGRMGMDKDSMATKALGFAGDMATDPLTYVGGALARGAVKGLGGGAGALGKALTGGESLAAGSALKPAREGILKFTRMQGIPAEMAQEFHPMLDGARNAVSQGAGVNAGKDILAGQLRSGGAGALADAIGLEGAGALPDAINATKNDVITDRFRQLARNMPGDSLGAYSPDARAFGVRANNIPSPALNGDALADSAASAKYQAASGDAIQNQVRTARHEAIHGMIDSAARSGDTSGLPTMMSVPAKLLHAGGSDISSALGGLGSIGDELAAQTLENRSLGGQLKSAAGFLLDPDYNAAYASHFANNGVNPMARRIYQSLPYANMAAGAAVPHTASALLQSL